MSSETPPAEVIAGDVITILPTLADASIDMVLTDPPYNSGALFTSARRSAPARKYKNVGGVSYGGESRDQRGFTAWSTIWLAECYRIAKPGAFLACFIDWRQLPAMSDAVQAAGWLWRGVSAWDKTPACRPYGPTGGVSHQCEYVVWATKGNFDHRPNIAGLVTARTPKERVHMAQKPQAVLSHFLQLCAPGGVVLDPFTGSGATGIAALTSGRSFVGIEIDPDIAAMARRRVDAVVPSSAQELNLLSTGSAHG